VALVRSSRFYTYVAIQMHMHRFPENLLASPCTREPTKVHVRRHIWLHQSGGMFYFTTRTSR
jgi:hypothetical protein